MSKLKHSDDYKGKIKRENERFSDRRKERERPIKSDYESEANLKRKRQNQNLSEKQNTGEKQSLSKENNLKEVKTENVLVDKEREPCDESLSFHEWVQLKKKKRKQAEVFRKSESKVMSGSEKVKGGAGDDYLEGGYGSDRYEYNKGNGHDVLNNYSYYGDRETDVLRFGEGISAEDLEVVRRGNDVTFSLKDGTGSVRVQEHFRHDYYKLDEVEFSDGAKWSAEDVASRTVAYGTDESEVLGKVENYSGNDRIFSGGGDDTVYAGTGDDKVSGESGDDKLYGQDGDDVLVGGAGDDYLEGGYGSDRYEYNKGDGHDVLNNYSYYGDRETDVLRFGEGISAEDLEVVRRGNDVTFSLKDGTGSVRVQEHFRHDYYKLDEVEFSDGTKWSAEDVASRTVAYGTDENDVLGKAEFYGGNDTIRAGGGDDEVYAGTGDDKVSGESGDDKLYGQNGDDVLVGGSGDDYLEGGYGSDRYEYNTGDGHDVINNYAYNGGRETDVLRFGEGISAEDLDVVRRGNDVTFSLKDGSGSVRVQEHFGGAQYNLDEVEFSDGTKWSAEDVASRTAIHGTGTNAAASAEPSSAPATPEALSAVSPLSAMSGADAGMFLESDAEESLAVLSVPSFVSEPDDGVLGGWSAGPSLASVSAEPSVPADFEVARLGMDIALAGLSFETPNSGQICDTVVSGSIGMESVKLSVSTETGLEKHFEEGVRPAELPRSV